MLASQLPSESSLIRKISDGDSAWTIEAQLLAAQADLTAVGNWQRGGGKGPRPKPIERPGVKPQTKRFGKGRSRQELNALLDKYVPTRRRR